MINLIQALQIGFHIICPWLPNNFNMNLLPVEVQSITDPK